MISLSDGFFLFGAGVLAGIVGTAGGISSLISYPALLAVGLPALLASKTNVVALVACWPGSSLASRPELSGKGPWLRRWAFVVSAGAVAGSALLLWTPEEIFKNVVPYLLVVAAVSLLLQPRISRWQQRHQMRAERLLPWGLFPISAYNGYFGAGSGVMTLALLLMTADSNLARANALKNMVVGVATAVSALCFIAVGHIAWQAAVPLATGGFAGSTVGPVVARRIPGEVLRWLVAIVGIAVAVRMWVVTG